MSQELTNTSGALLGLLSFGRELTGYELKKWADDSLRFFWAAPAMSQVYTELDRLRDAGFVSAREVTKGRRTSTVYRITRKGSAVLRAWLERTTHDEPVLKHGIALRVFFGHLVDPDTLASSVEGQIERCRSLLADLAVVRADLAGDPQWAYADLVATWGEKYYAAEAEALTDLLASLRARSFSTH